MWYEKSNGLEQAPYKEQDVLRSARTLLMYGLDNEGAIPLESIRTNSESAVALAWLLKDGDAKPIGDGLEAQLTPKGIKHARGVRSFYQE